MENLSRLRSLGYTGGKSAVYELVKAIRPPKSESPEVRFEDVPGEFSQHDFGNVKVAYADGSSEKIHFFALRLKYSRWTQVVTVAREMVEPLIRSLLPGFESFGGVPLRCVFDKVAYPTYSADAANVLLKVVDHRYLHKKPMLFTTNKPLNQWGRVLHDGDLAEDITDRMLERGRLIQLRGSSDRTRHLKNTERGTDALKGDEEGCGHFLWQSAGCHGHAANAVHVLSLPGRGHALGQRRLGTRLMPTHRLCLVPTRPFERGHGTQRRYSADQQTRLHHGGSPHPMRRKGTSHALEPSHHRRYVDIARGNGGALCWRATRQGISESGGDGSTSREACGSPHPVTVRPSVR